MRCRLVNSTLKVVLLDHFRPLCHLQYLTNREGGIVPFRAMTCYSENEYLYKMKFHSTQEKKIGCKHFLTQIFSFVFRINPRNPSKVKYSWIKFKSFFSVRLKMNYSPKIYSFMEIISEVILMSFVSLIFLSPQRSLHILTFI